MSGRTFVDTNILVYAHDADAGEKYEIARDRVTQLWQDRSGVISVQILQELYVCLRRKLRAPLGTREAHDLIADYLTWPLIVNDGSLLLRATEIEQRFRLSFWDALVVQAAQDAHATVLWSEDMGHERQYGTVTVVNPFR